MFENDHMGRDSSTKKDSLAAELDAVRRLCDFSSRLLGTKDVSIMMEDLLQAVLAVKSADLWEIRLHNSISNSLDLVASSGFRPALPNDYGGMYEPGSPAWRPSVPGSGSMPKMSLAT